MPDELDRVQGQNDEFQSDSLDAHFRNRSTGPGSEICIDCEEPIPLKRREVLPHCTRCVECQQLFEGGKP